MASRLGRILNTKQQNRVPSLASIVATLSSVGVLVVSIVVDVEEPSWLTVSSLCCFVLAVLFAVPPFFHLKRLGKPQKGAAYFSTTAVVDAGLYSVVRHPQYLGYALFVLGFACLDPHWLSAALAVCACALFYLQAILEERYCSRHFGQEYDDYRVRVPRFNFVQGVFKIILRHLR